MSVAKTNFCSSKYVNGELQVELDIPLDGKNALVINLVRDTLNGATGSDPIATLNSRITVVDR